MSVSLENLHRCSFAVDLGAARTRVYLKNVGVVVDEPSIVALNTDTGNLFAVGALAERMAGRTPPHIRIVHPVSGGTVVDILMAQRMLRQMLGGKLHKLWRLKPAARAAVCVPHDAEPLAQRAAVETLYGLGARRVEVVDTLIAAAVGCGLPVEHPEATMVVVCGAASTQIAVLSLGALVAAERIPVGGEAIDHAVLQHLRHQHELVLPRQSVHPLHLDLSLTVHGGVDTEVHGRDVATGLARTIVLDPEGVRLAIHTPLTAVLDGIGRVLRQCPPDLVGDLAERGIVLAGGSARLPGLDLMLGRSTGMPVRITERPDVCAVEGLGALIEGRVSPMHLDPPLVVS